MAVSAEFLNEAANYVHSVAHKWDFIGIKLYQDNLVQSLRYSEKSAAQKLTEILQGWLNGPRAPGDDLAAWRELVAALRSPAVNLDEMARKIEEVLHTGGGGGGGQRSDAIQESPIPLNPEYLIIRICEINVSALT